MTRSPSGSWECAGGGIRSSVTSPSGPMSRLPTWPTLTRAARRRAAEVESLRGQRPRTVQDFRRVLDDKRVDALRDRHTRPLARAGHDLGLPGRQGRLCREANQP